MAASRPQKYADGGQMGGQPALGIQYADGGRIGTSNDDKSTLNSNTAGDNFGDYMRQQQLGAEGNAPPMAVQYSMPAPTATGGAANGGANAAGLGTNQDRRDVATSPMTPGERKAAPYAIGAVAGLMGPLGGLVNAASNYSFGRATGMPVDGGLMSTAGANVTSGMGVADAFKSALWHKTGGLIGAVQNAPAANPMQADPATMQGQDSSSLGAVNNVAAQNDSSNSSESGGSAAGTAARDGMSFGGMGSQQSSPSGGSAEGGGGDASGGGDRGTRGGFADGGLMGQDPGAPPPQQMPVQQGPNPTMATAGLQMQPQGGATAAPGGDPMHPAIAALHVQNQLANPQVMQAIIAHLTQAMDAGQVNPQQLQMMGQLAQSAMQHPEIWPKLRQFAIQIGMPDAQNLPQQFNQQICMALLAAAQAHQHGDTQGAFKNGGMLHGPGTGISDSIQAHNTSTGQPVKLSNGEYIIPADVVATKGKEFFDNIVRKYHTPAAMQPR